MKLVRFWTKYGYKVIGGRFDFCRSPSNDEENNAPIQTVLPEIAAKAEEAHAAVIKEYRQSWNLE